MAKPRSVTPIPQKMLLGTDLTVSTLGLGCAKLGGLFQGGTAQDHRRLIRMAREFGVTLFDTADIYTQGESERMLGDELADERGSVVLASKAGYLLPRRAPLVDRAKPLLRPLVRKLGLQRLRVPAPLRTGPVGQDFSSAHIVQAVEGSLRRLRTDYLDILFLHSPPRTVLEQGPFLDGVTRLIRAGKIRWFGVSCESALDAHLAFGHVEVSCLQLPLSVLEQDAIDVAAVAARAGKGVVARQCLASGFLAEDSIEAHLAVLHPAARGKMVSDVGRLSAVASRMGRTLPAAALGFSMATPGVETTLVGARTVAQLREAVEWAEQRPLDRVDYAAFRESASASD
jgi:aryl-alcohol dehydrogenase-like predicted oxidoreductase